ncbi:zinc ABC transporter substrate-binding protein [Candidatus Acetothermia bacterium]|jgi:zinc transport system substrate-binding protein|nr:zinc ABC transporter substrate-binding protein [Candidatus Acetothermia bacterium]MCI2427270.1 zinc ABC transporter substrate-binding protein [Candidatus Acetothermia bacterium]MCI2428352.1 zinc ABC transporter substrate-binding protein [Candidatus Acetothermia bacterium]
MRDKRTKVGLTVALVVLLTVVFWVGAGTAGQTAIEDRLNVVVSFAVLHDFVTFIGGDRVEVTTMLTWGLDPCGWDPSPSDIKKLVGADIFIHLADFVDPWIDRVLAAAGSPYLVVVEAAKGLPIRLIGGVGDPHVWLDPVNVKVMVNTIMHALIDRDPAGEALYVENATRLQQQLNDLDIAFRTRLADLPLREFIVFHQALDYFAVRYGLVAHPLVMFWLDDPVPGRMVELIRLGRELGVRYIFTEKPGEELFEVLATEIGAEVLLFHISPLAPRAEGEELSAYVAMMFDFLDNLMRALRG